MIEKYEFDEDFEAKIAALALRDPTFNIRTDGLVKPDYLENAARATLVSLASRFWQRYKTTPSRTVLNHMIERAISSKSIRSDMIDEVKEAADAVYETDISDRDYVVDECASFARHQAIIAAMEKSVGLLDGRDFDAIEAQMKEAFQVAAHDDSPGHDLFADIEARSESRKEILAGKRIPAVTSGSKEFDARTADGGFTKGELAVLLGPAKRGKSFGLLNFAIGGAKAGHNVLMITLENSTRITTDRADAFLSGVATKELKDHIDLVEERVREVLKDAGLFKLHEYPTGAFSPRDLKRLIERYRAKGILFDEIVVDYWDIMKPSVSYRDDSIKESASIGIELRAIAKEENVAMLTAIQSNRDGFKAETAKAEHAAEDFNKVRLADLLFSINATEEERAAGLARIHFAAVRNTEGGYTIEIEQDLSKAIFIKKVGSRIDI